MITLVADTAARKTRFDRMFLKSFKKDFKKTFDKAEAMW